MIKRAEAEKVIGNLAIEWMQETGYRPTVRHYPIFPISRDASTAGTTVNT